MNNLGVMYQMGNGLDMPDYAKAREWFEKAAKSGNTISMKWLGFIYENGEGLEDSDYEKALEWYTKAVDAGDTDCQKDVERVKAAVTGEIDALDKEPYTTDEFVPDTVEYVDLTKYHE